MARPKKNTAEYFPHLCNHGKKMAYIERRYGNDGYAVWYKILEKLAEANDHYLYLENEIEADFLAGYCLVDLEKLNAILEDLVKVNALDNGAWKKKIVYSCTLLDSLADLYARRKDKPMTLMQILKQVSGVNVDIKPHSIGKDSIEEDSKLEERKAKEDAVVLEWVEYLNSALNKQHRPKSKRTRGLILDLCGEYSIEDLKRVIQSKKREWSGTDAAKHLVIITLLRKSNFELYYENLPAVTDDPRNATLAPHEVAPDPYDDMFAKDFE